MSVSMMTKRGVGACAALMMTGLVSANSANAQAGYGTADEATAMLDQVIALVAADPVAALVGINSCANAAGCAPGFEAFRDRDLYPFCVAWSQDGSVQDGYVAAHGTTLAVLGQREDGFVDVADFAFGQAIIDAAEAAGDGLAEVEYMWTRPDADGEFPKTAFLRNVPGQNIFCGVGIYHPE